MNVVEKTAGKKIEYSVRGSRITFADELMLNLESRERDTEMQIDICEDVYGCLCVGVGAGARRYVAQIVIPARQYREVEVLEAETETMEAEAGEDENGSGGTMGGGRTQEAVPFSMNNCTLILWGME